MERMVKLADVLAIINAGMFDLRSLRDNIALQEAIRSLPTVDAEPVKQEPRLIDANEILKSEHQHYNPMADEYYVPVRDIESALTVDAVPVRHGRWTVTPVFIKCSECGESFMLIPQNYCPNCGAKMDEERKR